MAKAWKFQSNKLWAKVMYIDNKLKFININITNFDNTLLIIRQLSHLLLPLPHKKGPLYTKDPL